MKSLLFFMVLIVTAPAFSATAQEVLMEGSFIDAAERENVALLRKRIQIRLKGPFSDFVDEFFHLTKTGGNIFHALAGVKTNQEEFAKTLEELIRISFSKSDADSKTDTLTLAGMEIHPKVNLEDTLLFQAIRTGKQQKISKAMEAVFETGPALSALSYLHSRVGSVPLLPREYDENKNKEMVTDSLKKMSSLSPYLKQDYNKFFPIDIAKKNKNLPAFDVLSVSDGWINAGAYIASGVLVGAFGGFAGALVYLDTVYHASLSYVFLGNILASIAGGFIGRGVLPVCHRAFTRKIIAPEEEGKTSIFKDSRFFSSAEQDRR